jgi:hypothetical protein
MSIGGTFVQTAEQKLSELLHRTTSCFTVKSLTIQEIRPQNKELAESLEKAARVKENEELEKRLACLRAERAAIEREEEEKEQESKLRLQKLQEQHGLESEREKLKLEQEKSDARISTQKKVAELLGAIAGRMAVFPKETSEYLLKELDVRIIEDKERQKLIRDLLKNALSFQVGQLSALKAVIAQHTGIHLSEESPLHPVLSEGEEKEEKEDAQESNETKDSSKTPELIE